LSIEAEKIDNKELTEEFAEEIKPPEVDPFQGYSSVDDFIYDSMIGFCQMISITYKKEFNATEYESNVSGKEAVERCITNLQKRADGVPYIDTTPEMPTITDHYEHNMMFFMGNVIEPAIPSESKPESEIELSKLFISSLEKLKNLFNVEMTMKSR